MIIGYDASRAFTNRRTGVENYSFELLRAMAEGGRGHRLVVYTRETAASTEPSGSSADAALPDSGLTKNFVASASKFDLEPPTSNLEQKVIAWPFLWTQGGLALETWLRPPDVLFIPAHTVPFFKRPRVKTVVTVHDLWTKDLPQKQNVLQRLYLNSWMEKARARVADHLIAVSEATKADVVELLGVPESKVSVVYEGVDHGRYAPEVRGQQSEIRKTLAKYGIEQPYLLFVGTLQPRKNLKRLVEAFARVIYGGSFGASQNHLFARSRTHDIPTVSQEDFATVPNHNSQSLSAPSPPPTAASGFRPPAHKGSGPAPTDRNSVASASYLEPRTSNLELVIAGSPGWQTEEICAAPARFGVEDRVKFVGYVDDNDLPYLYAGADALVFPSLHEGFGLPVLEAMAVGTPVVVSRASSLPEVAGKAGIYVDPLDVDSIAAGIDEVLKMDQATYARRSQAGVVQAQHFTWHRSAQETLEVLEEVLERVAVDR